MKCCIFPRKKFHSNGNRNHNWILSWKYFYTIAWLLVLNCAFVLGFHLVPLLMKGSKFHSSPHVLSMSMSIEGVRGRQLIDHSIARGFLSREGGKRKATPLLQPSLLRQLRVNSTRDRCPDYYCCFFSSWAPIFPTLLSASHAEGIFPPLAHREESPSFHRNPKNRMKCWLFWRLLG